MAVKIQESATITRGSLAEDVKSIVNLDGVRCRDLVDEIFDFIECEISHGRRFPIVGAGRLAARVKKARPGRNPKTGEFHEVKPMVVVTLARNSKGRDSQLGGPLSTRHAFRENLVDKFGISPQQSKDIHEMFVGKVAGIAENKGRMEIRGFGSFFAVKHDARMARNPKTGKEVTIDEHVKVGFKLSKKGLRQRIQSSNLFGRLSQ